MKQEVTTAKSTQSAMPELGIEEKTLYYLVIGESPNSVKLNIGKKTYNAVKSLTEKKEAHK